MSTLQGIRVIEMAALGPVPFCAMSLADMGADVVRINPPSSTSSPNHQTGPLWRGRGFMELDLKSHEGREQARDLVSCADILLEGFRPGVMERLGLGADELLRLNPGLVYVRTTGWGQSGELRDTAGHDINYLAATGILRHIGRAGSPPTPPLNLVGDYGGGGMLALVGTLAALLEKSRSGLGQIVDAAMVDGATLLMSSVLNRMNVGQWHEPPGTNVIDSGAPFYDVYETSDHRYLAVGAIEPVFYNRFILALGLDPAAIADQMDRTQWPELKRAFAERIADHDLDHWSRTFDGLDACVNPVLTLDEAYRSRHNQDRMTLKKSSDGGWRPAAAPRFDRTPSVVKDDEKGREAFDVVWNRWARNS